MSDHRSGNSGTLVGGFLLGAAVGAVTGLLLAPKSGQETRRLLKKSADALPEIAEDLSSNMQVQADRLSSSALKNWDDTLGRLKEAIAAGIEASRNENNRLSNASNLSSSQIPGSSNASQTPTKALDS